jgi:hypothetical protein
MLDERPMHEAEKTFHGRLMDGWRETGVSRASTTTIGGVDFSYRFAAAA